MSSPIVEVTNTIILKSIIKMLSDTFGDNYKYYDEVILQNFKRPCFHVQRIILISEVKTDNDYCRIYDNTYRYAITYFTKEETNKIEDINDITDKLIRLFGYVDIVNFNGDDTTVSYKKVLDRNINVVDGTLVFDFKFRMLLTEEKSPQLMKKHILIKEIKE